MDYVISGEKEQPVETVKNFPAAALVKGSRYLYLT